MVDMMIGQGPGDYMLDRGGDGREEQLRDWLKSELRSLQQGIRSDFEQCLLVFQEEHRQSLRYQAQLLQQFSRRRGGVKQSKIPTSLTTSAVVASLSEKPDDRQSSSSFKFAISSQNGSRESLRSLHTPGTTTARLLSELPPVGGLASADTAPKAANTFENLDQAEYTVEDFYKNEGWAQAVARSNAFMDLTLFVITLNAMYLGIDAMLNPSEFLWSSTLPFIVGEILFCAFFVSEWLIRLAAFEAKRNCLKDAWFKFDSVLAVLMVCETLGTGAIFWATGENLTLPTAPLRLFRMLRLARLVRLLRHQPELLTIARGLQHACRGVMSTMIFIGLANYAGGLLMYSILRDEAAVGYYFRTLPLCMWTLILHGTLTDSPGLVMNALLDAETINCTVGLIAFVGYLALTAFMLLNLLIGILCEVVTSVSIKEKENAARDTIIKELLKYATSDNGCISGLTFQAVLKNKASRAVLKSINIDLRYLQDFQDLYFRDDPYQEVSINKVVRLLLDCRGDERATVKSVATSTRLTLAWLEQIMDALKQQDKDSDAEDCGDEAADLTAFMRDEEELGLSV